MSLLFQPGKNEQVTNAHFKTSPFRGNQFYFANLAFKFLQKLSRQTDGTVGVMSNSAVDDLNGVFHETLPLKRKLYQGSELC